MTQQIGSRSGRRSCAIAGRPFTRGALCNKVNDYIAYTQAPERLLYPMRRVGQKGGGSFERISWDEALAEISERLLKISEEFGASRHVVTICTIAGGFGTGYTLGNNRVGMDPETLRFSKLIILWGANTLSTNSHLWRSISTARRNGAFLVVIDPIRTRTAAAADCHLAPTPGTDAALALGLMNVVLTEGAEDRDFIENCALGWDAFRERILEFPPERVADICGLRLESIVALGKRVAHTRPTGIRIGIGLQRHGGGGMAVRTITCLPVKQAGPPIIRIHPEDAAPRLIESETPFACSMTVARLSQPLTSLIASAKGWSPARREDGHAIPKRAPRSTPQSTNETRTWVAGPSFTITV